MSYAILPNCRNHKNYKKASMLGDHFAKDLVDYYVSQKKTIMTYQGKSSVDRKRFAFYENILIEDSWEKFWHHYSKKYLTSVLWFLRRLKVGITPQEEYELLVAFVNRLNYFERVYAVTCGVFKNEDVIAYFEKNKVKSLF